jgi:hypothetical protein
MAIFDFVCVENTQQTVLHTITVDNNCMIMGAGRALKCADLHCTALDLVQAAF